MADIYHSSAMMRVTRSRHFMAYGHCWDLMRGMGKIRLWCMRTRISYKLSMLDDAFYSSFTLLLWTFIRYQESCLLFNSLVPRSPVNTNVNESYSIVNSSTRLFESLIIQIDETRLQDRQVWISEWLFNSMVLHLN